jgi:hypothetical protein
VSNGNVTSALTTFLSTLTSTPGVFTMFGNQLTQSNEMKALQLIDTMQLNPLMAPNLFSALAGIKGVPANVVSLVSDALATPANFATGMSQAKAALLSTHLGISILGQ